MAAMCQEKLPTLNDVVGLVDFFFRDIEEYEAKAVKKQWRKEGAAERLQSIRDAFADLEEWTAGSLKSSLEALVEESDAGFGPFVHSTRLALTGKSVGPGLFELAELLGCDATLARLDQGLEYIRGLEAEAGV